MRIIRLIQILIIIFLFTFVFYVKIEERNNKIIKNVPHFINS